MFWNLTPLMLGISLNYWQFTPFMNCSWGVLTARQCKFSAEQLSNVIHSLVSSIQMKTPQHWHTSCVYVIIISATLTLFGVMKSFCHDVVTSRHRPGYFVRLLICIWSFKLEKPKKITFLTEWPWPLTYDLDHQIWPRFHQGQFLYQVLCPYVKRFGSESAEELTDGRTDF